MASSRARDWASWVGLDGAFGSFYLGDRTPLCSWMTKGVCWLILFSLVGWPCFAVPINSDRASQAARRWLELSPSPMGKGAGKLGKTSAYANPAGEARFYVVDLAPTGFVVVAADDELEPIIAFSPTGQFGAEPGNPLFALLQKDTEGRTRQLHAESAANHGGMLGEWP